MRVSLIFCCFFLCCYSLGFSQVTKDSIKVVPVDSLTQGAKDSVVVNDKVASIISFAKTFLGTPYHWGGTTPSGFDCSGFINYIFGSFGFSLVRTSYSLAELGQTVSLSEIQPGDLMFFKGRSVNSTTVGHVAMVVEVNNGVIKFIHSSTSRGVVIDTFNGSQYYVPRYLKAKRLDYGVVDASNFR